MKNSILSEGKFPERLPVYLTFKLSNKIDSIISYNRNNVNGVRQFLDYIETLKRYISDTVIAWDNMMAGRHGKNGLTCIKALGYNTLYLVKISKKTGFPYVCIVEIYPDFRDFELNIPPVKKRIKNSKNSSTSPTTNILLKESDIRSMVKECIRRILTESTYKPFAKNTTIKLDNGVKTESLVTLSDGAGRFDIYEDDGCYVVWNRNYKGENNHWYMFPELLSALKRLPNLPLR